MSRFLDAAQPPPAPEREPIPALMRIEAAVRTHLAGDSAELAAVLEVDVKALPPLLDELEARE